jgi:hypothetical protein
MTIPGCVSRRRQYTRGKAIGSNRHADMHRGLSVVQKTVANEYLATLHVPYVDRSGGTACPFKSKLMHEATPLASQLSISSS